MEKADKHTPDTGRADSRTPDGQRTGGQSLSGAMSGAPRWVRWFTDIGRPLSAIVVMVLCAPGERHLAELAGFGPLLSWGMAGLLVMYAGIAAVVATVRPKGAPGKRTAVLGAIVSLLLAMAAQPVSHYFVTGWMTADPRPPFWLVTIVSCIPPFVMGHLLHLAADPGTAPDGAADSAEATWEAEMLAKARAARTQARTARAEAGEAPEETVPDPDPLEDRAMRPQADTESWGDAATWTPDLAEDHSRTAQADGYRAFTADMMRAQQERQREAYLSGGHPETVQRTWLTADNGSTGGHGQPLADFASGYTADFYPVVDNGVPTLSAVRNLASGIASAVAPDGRTVVGIDPAGQPDSGQPDSGRTGGRTAGQPDSRTADMSAFIRDTWSLQPGMDRTEMRAAVRRSFPDKKADAIRKAVTRAEEAGRS